MDTSRMQKIGTLSAGVVLALTLAACQKQQAARTAAEPPADESGSAAQTMPPPASDTSSSSGMSSGTEGQSYSAMGTVTAVDAGTGKVSIQHEAIGDASMQAGTTEFDVQNRDALSQISKGQQVDFSFTQSGGQHTITQITPAAGQSSSQSTGSSPTQSSQPPSQ